MAKASPFVSQCRSCGGNSLVPILSLGMTPIANALLSEDDLAAPEPLFPLGVALCQDCHLVQLYYELPADAIFTDDYPYYASYADIVVESARQHVDRFVAERRLGPEHLVVEVASNDGYLLTRVKEHGVKVLGIDPSPGPAAVAQAAGIPTLVEFFGTDVAGRLRDEGVRADVIVANNVMAHVPDLNDFVAGFATLLADDGVLTVENPWVHELVRHTEFDTIYHEHFCYFSCLAVDTLFRRHGLYLHRIELLPDLHGGTVRWTATKTDDPEPSVAEFLDRERAEGMDALPFYSDFGLRVAAIQKELIDLLHGLKAEGRTIAAYGAAAKGVTLLTSSRISSDVVDFVVDRNVHKQGHYLPGLGIPIVDPVELERQRPDYLLLLAWNHATEIARQLRGYVEDGGRFIVPVPKPQVVEA